MSGAGLEIADGGGLRVCCWCITGDGDSGILDGIRCYDVEVGAGGVVLVFAGGSIAVDVGSGGPLPDPVGGEGTHGDSVWNLDVRLTPGLNTGGVLTDSVVGSQHLALLRDASAVDLVASAVVEVLGRHEKSALVAGGAGGVPLHDVGDGFGVGRPGGAEDKDSAAGGRLASDVPRQSGVTVLEVLHGNVVAGRDLQFRVGGSIVGGALLRWAHQVGGVDVSAGGLVAIAGGGVGEEPQHGEAVEGWVRAWHISAGVSHGAGVGAIVGDDLVLLDPAVGGDAGRAGDDERGKREAFAECEHGRVLDRGCGCVEVRVMVLLLWVVRVRVEVQLRGNEVVGYAGCSGECCDFVRSRPADFECVCVCVVGDVCW